MRDEAILFNPLRDFTPDLPNHVACHRFPGGQALTRDQKEQVIDYLLYTDVSEIFAKGKNRAPNILARGSAQNSVSSWTLRCCKLQLA